MMKTLSKTRGIGVRSGAIMERERVVRALESAEYMKGYNAAIREMKSKMGIDLKQIQSDSFAVSKVLSQGNTWGLTKTRVVIDGEFIQKYTGKGIKVCVLDTGIDLNHPDFKNRAIETKSFVPNQTVQDAHGHGTHCAGTAVGILNPTKSGLPRYSVAHEANLFVGKVLSNAGSGADGWILGGINWALANKCEVISMSLGGDTDTADFSQVYESAANIALSKGSLIIAAAGNSFPSSPAVNHPANCPSIMAVGAVNDSMVKASFSCIGKFPPAGKVDIAGPGVQIFSSVSKPHKGLSGIGATEIYGNLNGTSMATPHVAGIAALHAQQRKTRRGNLLWQRLVTTALPLNQTVSSVGAGLVQAPYTKKARR
jgi:subtilisin family serine protease